MTNHGLLQDRLLAVGQTVTNGDGAYGIFGQSIGGGGGSGGNAITGCSASTATTRARRSMSSRSAARPRGNKGGNVTYQQYGGMRTNGMGAFAPAQSIGGGGGTGGRAIPSAAVGQVPPAFANRRRQAELEPAGDGGAAVPVRRPLGRCRQ